MRTRKSVILVVALALLAVPAVVLATDVFSDVPTEEFFHDPVNEIAEAKVTIGCTEDRTQFCPQDPTSRGEMATFLTRGMGRVAFSGVGEFVPSGADSTTPAEISSVTIEAGGAEPGGTAHVKLDASYVVEEMPADACEVACVVTVELRDSEGEVLNQSSSTLTPPHVMDTIDVLQVSQSGAITYVAEVGTSSSNEFTLVAYLSDGTGTTQAKGEISALYVPFDTEQPPAP
jgi:hypothetical protein